MVVFIGAIEEEKREKSLVKLNFCEWRVVIESLGFGQSQRGMWLAVGCWIEKMQSNLVANYLVCYLVSCVSNLKLSCS